MNKLIYLTIILLSFRNNLNAQFKTNYISYKQLILLAGDSNFNKPDKYLVPPFHDMPNKLPEGRYVIYNSEKKKKRRIEMYGEYSKDSLKNGTFMYFSFYNKERKELNLTSLIYHYQYGKLDGNASAYLGFNLYWSGNYKRGLRDGTFIQYSFGDPHYIEYESIITNDTLIKTIKYFENTDKVISEIAEYKNNGLVDQITYFNENGLKKVSYKTNESNTFFKTKFNEKGEIISTETVNRIEEKQLQQR